MTVMLDILVEHLEEIEFLWAQRSDALRSADYIGHEILELDDRIDAHLQGLLVGGAECVPLAEPLLAEEDRFVAFSGAWCLAKIGQFQVILDHLQDCNLDGVAEALCHCQIDPIVEQLAEQYQAAEVPLAAAIGLVLATHQKTVSPSRLAEFFSHEDPQVRRRAWETVTRSCDHASSHHSVP